MNMINKNLYGYVDLYIVIGGVCFFHDFFVRKVREETKGKEKEKGKEKKKRREKKPEYY